MTYLATSINNSAVISEKAGAVIADVRGKAVKYDTDGNVVLCSAAGEAAIGIGIMTNDETTTLGGDVDIQVKEIGLVLAGGAIAKGDELTTDANGKLVKATAGGQYVIAVAMDSAAAADVYIKAQMVKYPKAAAASSD